ncbi:uncharacterized protein LOC114188838 [Vigna unguiculata]|uniref:uncharacterized protein LOC114188838 n=1 Tax=Vigna unguiculata TaxID=3917 RepID=UPI0010168C81|nr:uncharacterized protein LOC114188838 [Vigna unguiculata]
MGNGLSMKLHKWSSPAFPEKIALICTCLTDKSKRSIFRLKVSPERVLLRLAESVCDHHPVRLFHMEVAAQRDAMNCFNFLQVRVVVDDTSQQTQYKGEDSLSDLCGRKSCFYEVMRKVESNGSVETVSWEFFHSYRVTLTRHIRYHVIIECDKETGIRANIRGPFECEGSVVREECPKGSPIQLVEKGKPSKAMRAFAESEFKGKEYILFACGASRNQSVNIVNTGAVFHGHGNASTYIDCKIDMQTSVENSPSS